ncbi:MAG: polysaccharide deacetylase family protein [Candidatus Margulisiibacteriota bacterium]
MPNNTIRKRFWTPNGLYITERVARSNRIGEGEITRPGKNGGVFLFRVDADLYLKEGQEAFLNIARKYGVKTTWFVNVGNYLGSPAGLEQLLNDDLVEVQSHAFLHRVYPDKARNINNLREAEKHLPPRRVKGVVAPYGIWNEGFQSALEELGINYSSEFGLAYDRAPFYPRVMDRPSTVIQIPIHPVCSGSFAYAGLPVDEACRYFARVIEEKHRQGIPIILYGHPNDRDIAYNSQVLDFIFNYASSLAGVKSLSFAQYYETLCLDGEGEPGGQMKTSTSSFSGPVKYPLPIRLKWLAVCLLSEIKQRFLDDILPPGGKQIVLDLWKRIRGTIKHG